MRIARQNLRREVESMHLFHFSAARIIDCKKWKVFCCNPWKIALTRHYKPSLTIVIGVLEERPAMRDVLKRLLIFLEAFKNPTLSVKPHMAQIYRNLSVFPKTGLNILGKLNLKTSGSYTPQ
jgi:hypothetical protein